MTEIQTFQDQSPEGTFSQIKLDNGDVILISLTQTEIAIFKIGFLGIPTGKIWKESMDEFLDTIYPKGPDSESVNKSVLEIAVELALQCKAKAEVQEKFENLME